MLFEIKKPNKEGLNMIKGLAIGGRFFGDKEGGSPQKIVDFAKRYTKIAEKVIIAIHIAKDKTLSKLALETLGIENLVAIYVEPWEKFVFALNALASKAALLGMDDVTFLSTEVIISENSLSMLADNVSEDTLCAGARMQEHEFHPNKKVSASDITVPWNVCCAWNLKKLSLIGFPLVGDALFDQSRKMAGVEEISTIAVFQSLFGEDKNKAKLIQLSDISWDNAFIDDPERLEQHRIKMASKCARPVEQMKHLGLPMPIVHHIIP
jgi:hypothetical protein